MKPEMRPTQEVKLDITTGTFIRFWLVSIGFVAVAGLLWLSRSTLILLAISFFLAIVLNRPVSFLARYLPGKSRTLAILVSYLCVAALIALFIFTVIPVFASKLTDFIANIPAMLQQIKANSGWFSDMLQHYNLTSQFDKWVLDVQSQLSTTASSVGQSLISTMSNVFNFVANLFMIIFLTFFMLLEAPEWEEKFWRLLYSNPKSRRRHKEVAKKMYNVVSGYVTGQATVGIISSSFTAIIVAILALIFDFNISLIWPAWITIFVMVFVPMFGAIIGGAIVTLLLLIYSLPAAIIYLVIFAIEQQIENNIIQPRIQSKHMQISALLILVAITLGLQMGGILGALVAIPVAGCVAVLIRDLLGKRRQSDKLTNDSDVVTASMIETNDLYSSNPVIFVKSDRTYVGPPAPIINSAGRKKSQRKRN